MARLRWLLGLTVGGVALSHLAAYKLATPDSHQLVHVLKDSGHAYLPLFVTLSLFALALTLVGFAAERFLKPPSGAVTPAGALMTMVKVAGLQAIAFVGMEVLERALSGNGFGLTGSPVALALLIQALIAALSVLVLLLIGRTVAAVISRRAAPRDETPSAIRVRLVRSIFLPRLLLLAGGLGLRGPPAGQLS